MDATDRAFVDALGSNARGSSVELGRIVGVSGPSVSDRVQRLEQTGVITGYRADAESPGVSGSPRAPGGRW
jgi:Lrp/AsnC family leucine-responsive transcriptional regulator